MTRSATQRTSQATITIRAVGAPELEEVEAIAERDSARVPAAPLLGAEVDGCLLAVTSLADGRTVADPFARTEDLRAMLSLRATQLREGNGRRLRTPRLRRRRRAQAALAASPPGAGGRLLTLDPARE